MRKRPIRLSILSALLLVAELFSGCELMTPSPPSTSPTPRSGPGQSLTPTGQTTPLGAAVSLVMSPNMLTFTDDQPTQSFFLSTTPSGSLEWRVTSKPDWVTVEPSQGLIDRNIVEVKVNATGLATSDPGDLMGRIEIISTGGVSGIVLQAKVAANPLLSLSHKSLDFTESAITNTLTISNTGRGVLTWKVTSSDPAISVLPGSGELSSGKSAEVIVQANRSGLPVGNKSVSLTVASNQMQGDVTLPVSLAVGAKPIVASSDSLLKFSQGVDRRSFTLSNTGTGPLSWSASGSQPWLAVAPASGELQPGANAQVSVSINRAALPSGKGEASITVKSNSATGDLALAVAVSSTTGAGPGKLWVLDHRVLDAEYNRKSGFIVTISTSPSRLHIIDPDLGTVESIDVPAPPTSVSVQPDGLYAAVGHDASITYVDLMKRAVARNYAVTVSVQDVVLPGNGWVYAFPGALSVNLTTGQEVAMEGRSIFAGPMGELHPSGDYIYSPSVGVSPSDVEKLDIRSGPAKLLYDSPYHGDYEFGVGSPGAGIWFSEDGKRMFTINGNVFRASPVAEEDMIYAGKLVGVSGLRVAASSTASRKVLALDGGSYREPQVPGLRVYDEEFLNFKGTVDLPQFSVPGGSGVGSEGHYIFINQNATLVFILVQAAQSSGIANDWAVATFEMSKLP